MAVIILQMSVVFISSWARKACSNGEDTPNRWSKVWRMVCVFAFKLVSSSYPAFSVWLCRVIFNAFMLHLDPCSAAATIGFRQGWWLIAAGKRQGSKFRATQCVREECAQLSCLFVTKHKGTRVHSPCWIGTEVGVGWETASQWLTVKKPGWDESPWPCARSFCCMSVVTQFSLRERGHFKQWHLNIA